MIKLEASTGPLLPTSYGRLCTPTGELTTLFFHWRKLATRKPDGGPMRGRDADCHALPAACGTGRSNIGRAGSIGSRRVASIHARAAPAPRPTCKSATVRGNRAQHRKLRHMMNPTSVALLGLNASYDMSCIRLQLLDELLGSRGDWSYHCEVDAIGFLSASSDRRRRRRSADR